MSNHIISLLENWYPLRGEAEWVLGTVYKTEGPCYRKAGAMMLLSSQGHQLGMLSGGCLESDIHSHSRRVMLSGESKTLVYDGKDEDDVSYQLGIGCGGRVYILLQPLTAANEYLQLPQMLEALKAQQSGFYFQQIPAQEGGEVSARFMPAVLMPTVAVRDAISAAAQLINQQNTEWLRSYIAPPPHLLIVGGGVDARPLAAIAQTLGWQLTLWDPRPANGRREHFPGVKNLLSCSLSELIGFIDQHPLNAAVLMSHNIQLDAQALAALKDTAMDYLGLLGPINRKTDILVAAGVSEADLATPLTGPAGLAIGAQLPETIALSILAQCQAAIGKGSCASLNQPVSEAARGYKETMLAEQYIF